MPSAHSSETEPCALYDLPDCQLQLVQDTASTGSSEVTEQHTGSTAQAAARGQQSSTQVAVLQHSAWPAEQHTSSSAAAQCVASSAAHKQQCCSTARSQQSSTQGIVRQAQSIQGQPGCAAHTKIGSYAQGVASNAALAVQGTVSSAAGTPTEPASRQKRLYWLTSLAALF
eukprot:scaffold43224_cov30-Tisochrysis_lutea.AAC.1